MAPTLDQICCASLPRAQLGVLADLRREAAIRVLVRGDRAWVRWPAGHEGVMRRLFPVSTVALFAKQDGLWYQLGRHLPTFGIPREFDADSVPLATALVPAPIDVTMPRPGAPRPAQVGLVRDEEVRPASALRCRLNALSVWAETVPSSQFKPLRAAIAGDLVMLLGSPLPAIAGGTRYWGTRLLIPLGYRVDPGLSENALRRALSLGSAELLVLTPDGYEVIPPHVFNPLSLAGIRLAERTGHA
ncbi:hypothetical protein SAMN05444166_7058 [Singulisphaera sp. GP187]|uniref:hypothetical protein n=1 Tax=Singulisphaera sp. GP187 TaxID=1882752 RepID=UPI000926CD22|nr:hypothetical protein [Singulisphaera sp. GP187]SIO62478.1 hypothetical protein SAMN05444166_7058 [Singulisphaera sp. GP187]